MELITSSPTVHGAAKSRARAVGALLTVSAMIYGTALLSTPAHAAETVTVDTVDDLRAAFNDATTDTTVTLGTAFPDELSTTVTLSNSADVAIVVDGAGKTLQAPPTGRHLSMTVGGSGSAVLSNLSLEPRSGATNGGLEVSLEGTAQAEVSALTISGLGQRAFGIGGSGSGHLLVEDVTLQGNSAGYASALGYGRGNADATTTMNNISVLENNGLSGGGYSGGAMLIGAGSRGAVTIQNSLFRDNSFVDGGSQPRGGAIAVHNSHVQLTLDNDLFEGNSTYSSTSPANADGGAVSVFNPNTTATGSLVVTNSTFVGNTAEDDGAAIFVEGQNSSSSRPFTTNLTVKNTTFADNISGGETSDTGGAIQASLRVDVNISNSTFFGNTKASGRGGVDFGVHTTINSGGFQRPIGELSNNVFTRSNSVAGTLGSTFTCTGGVSCKVPTGQEDAHATGIFGSANPSVGANGTAVIAGDSRAGSESKPVPTLAIVPPLTGSTPTASRIVTDDTGLAADQRGVAYRAAGPQDAGSFTMDYVRFDAATNGGSWSGLTPQLPGAQGTFVGDAAATNGWFEVAAPGASVPAPITAPTPPAGHTFVGWFDSATGGQAITAPIAAAAQTVYAQFQPNDYVVTFDPDNGEATSTETVAHGGTATEPTPPVKDGFTFTGWTLDGAPYDFATQVESDLTLVATWEEAEVPNHTVTFDPDNGEATSTVTVADGAEVEKPSADPVKDGFTFTGWMLDAAAYDFTAPVKGDLLLVAGWEEVEVPLHTVTFDPANDSATTTIQVADGDPVGEPADPIRDGFTFEGWTLNGSPYAFTTPVTADITLVATWAEIPLVTYTVTFDPDNGGDTFSQQVIAGETAARPGADPTREGYVFTGWTLNGAAYDFATAVSADITLTAGWELAPVGDHTVTFDPQNGETAFTVTVPHGGSAAKPADPIRDGYSFTGWTLSGAPYDFASAVVSDITLVAGWEAEAVVTHTVTFDPANGASVTQVKVANGGTVARPADPVREGFTFTGWTRLGAAYDFATPVTTDVTLVAGWSAIVAPPVHPPKPPTIESTGGESLLPTALAATLLLGLGTIAVIRARRLKPQR